MEESGYFSIEKSTVAELHEFDEQIASQTLIVVVDVRNKREVVLRNPSSSLITAVYADENVILLGSYAKIFHLTPSRLFQSEISRNFDPQASTFKEVSLPPSHSTEVEIYAFWHTKN